MKKLMIAAAIVCAAVVSQAAQYNWVGEEQIFAGYDGGSGAGVNGTAYLINASVLAYADAVTALEGKDYSTIVSKAYATKSGDPTVAEEGTFDGYTPTGIAITEGDSLYALIIEDETDWAYLTTTVESPEADPYGSTLLLFENEADRSAAGTGWYNVAAVPEPTSGLLLLLGVAGLALRRRRA